jgi:glycosyltransferase involved in cell wall biosynthesis
VRLLVDASATPGVGAGYTRLRELVRELAHRASQHEVAFVVRPSLRAEMEEIATGAAAVISPSPHLGAAPARVAWQLTRLPYRARPFAPDVVLSLFNIVAPRWPEPRPRLAVMVSNLAPFSSEIRRASPIRARPREVVLRRLTRSAVERADLVLFQSRFGLETVTAECATARHVVIPHSPPSLDQVRRPRLTPVPAPYVAVVANRYPYKGIETVLEAAARIEARLRPRLALVGARPDRRYAARLDRLVNLLRLREHVVDLGALPHGVTLAVMADASACVACSRFENLSRIPGEAMALGTPLIASDIASHREAAGRAALYYGSGDDGGLATAVRRVLDDGPTRDALIAAGNARTASARRADPVGVMITALEELAAGAPAESCRARSRAACPSL